MATTDTKARKGMVAVVKRSHSTFTLGSAGGVADRESYELGVVRKADRTGMALEVDTFGGGIARKRDHDWRAVYLVPEVSPEDAEKVAYDHHWSGHPRQPQPFDDVSDLRAALSKYKR